MMQNFQRKTSKLCLNQEKNKTKNRQNKFTQQVKSLNVFTRDSTKQKKKLSTQGSFEDLIIQHQQSISSKQTNFRIDQEEIQNYDDQLKEYISGQKIFKQRNLKVIDFSKVDQKQRLTHKKTKSKSYVLIKKGSSLFKQNHRDIFSNRNYTKIIQTPPIFQQNDQINNLNSFKGLNRKNNAKYLQPKYNNFSSSFYKKSVQINFLFKKLSQKQKNNINQLMKRLNISKQSYLSKSSSLMKQSQIIKKQTSLINIYKNSYKNNTQQKTQKFVYEKSNQNKIVNKKVIIDLSKTFAKIQQKQAQQLKKLEKQNISLVKTQKKFKFNLFNLSQQNVNKDFKKA